MDPEEDIQAKDATVAETADAPVKKAENKDKKTTVEADNHNAGHMELDDNDENDQLVKKAIGQEKDGKVQDAIATLETAVAAGSTKAMLQLSLFYQNNKEVRNPEKCYQYCVQAAEKENVDAIYQLGLLFKGGFGAQRDLGAAVRYFTVAANKGHLKAQYQLAEAYMEGRGVEKNETSGMRWLNMAAERGDGRAQATLGQIFQKGNEVITADPVKAFQWTEKSANTGVAGAQYTMGSFYEKGENVTEDMTAAFEWYLKSAEQNFPAAIVAVANCYRHGKGTEKNDDKCFEWAKRGVEVIPNKTSKRGKALYLLGSCYDRGQGVEENAEEASKYFKEGSDLNDAACSLSFANMLLTGRGGNEVDKDKAVSMFRKAGETGDPRAQFQLGSLYSNGVEGVMEADHEEAVYWFTKAAQQDFPPAQYNLAVCYYKGTGVDKDTNEAKEWFTKAAENGDSQAEDALKKLFTTVKNPFKKLMNKFSGGAGRTQSTEALKMQRTDGDLEG